MKFHALLLLASLAVSALAQTPKVGELAPEIVLEKVVSPPARPVPNLAGMKGKVVVMEFWGTWCGHCIKSIPHLNKLADAFKSRGVEFLSVSDEREKVVAEFLSKTPISGTVAVDSDGSVVKRYGVVGFPTTFIIDKSGKIAGITHPDSITEQTIEDALAGRPLRMKEEAKIETSAKPLPKPLFEVWVRPAASNESMGSYGPDNILGFAISPQDALSWAFDVPVNRLVIETPLPEEKLDLKAASTPGDPNVLPAFRLALASALKVKITHEEREMDVYLLTPIDGAPHKLEKPGTEGARAGMKKDNVSGTNSSLEFLIRFIDQRTGVPTLDETKLSEKYNYDLKAEKFDFESMRKSLRDQLGLDLRKERRKLSVVVIRKL